MQILKWRGLLLFWIWQNHSISISNKYIWPNKYLVLELQYPISRIFSILFIYYPSLLFWENNLTRSSIFSGMGIVGLISQNSRRDWSQWLQQLHKESLCEQIKEVACITYCVCKISCASFKNSISSKLRHEIKILYIYINQDNEKKNIH